MSAQLVGHVRTLDQGTPRFWIVQCLECEIVLNSGRQYEASELAHAHRLADTHNEAEHAAPTITITVDEAMLRKAIYILGGMGTPGSYEPWVAMIDALHAVSKSPRTDPAQAEL